MHWVALPQGTMTSQETIGSERPQLTAVRAAELRGKGNVIDRHASAAGAVEGHFKDHLQGDTQAGGR